MKSLLQLMLFYLIFTKIMAISTVLEAKSSTRKSFTTGDTSNSTVSKVNTVKYNKNNTIKFVATSTSLIGVVKKAFDLLKNKVKVKNIIAHFSNRTNSTQAYSTTSGKNNYTYITSPIEACSNLSNNDPFLPYIITEDSGIIIKPKDAQHKTETTNTISTITKKSLLCSDNHCDRE